MITELREIFPPDVVALLFVIIIVGGLLVASLPGCPLAPKPDSIPAGGFYVPSQW